MGWEMDSNLMTCKLSLVHIDRLNMEFLDDTTTATSSLFQCQTFPNKTVVPSPLLVCVVVDLWLLLLPWHQVDLVNDPTPPPSRPVTSTEADEWDDDFKPLQTETKLIFRIKSEVAHCNPTCFKTVKVPGDL